MAAKFGARSVGPRECGPLYFRSHEILEEEAGKSMSGEAELFKTQSVCQTGCTPSFGSSRAGLPDIEVRIGNLRPRTRVGGFSRLVAKPRPEYRILSARLLSLTRRTVAGEENSSQQYGS
jgi:hypothetical protein